MKIQENKRPLIIDKTIPEIMLKNKDINISDIRRLCCLFMDLGVDLIEITPSIYKKLGVFNAEIPFILRLESNEEVDFCILSGIKSCIIERSYLNNLKMLKKLGSANIDITIDINLDNYDDLHNLFKLKYLEGIDYVKAIRINSISCFLSSGWHDEVHGIRNILNKRIEICPSNEYYLGTSIAVECIEKGYDAVTVTFTGFGREGGFAPLEEVMLSAKVLINNSWPMDLKYLQKIKTKFEHITGEKIHGFKAVVGDNIFTYESGIHADGIEKNPTTYEPFDPSIIGLNRKLQIGKHSGKGAIIGKCRELGIDSEKLDIAKILDCVRELSIELKRGLKDEEILKLCGGDRHA